MYLSLYTCEEALRRLDDYLDRELTPIEMARVRKHLLICHRCAKRFAFEARFIHEMRAKAHRIETPHDLTDKISRFLARERETEKDGEG